MNCVVCKMGTTVTLECGVTVVVIRQAAATTATVVQIQEYRAA